MRVLFLSQRVPYPPNRGDKITTWRLVERMARKHEVHILAFAHDDKDVEAAGQLEAMGFRIRTFRAHPRWDRIRSIPLLLGNRPLTLGVYGSKDLQREVDAIAGDFDLAYAYSSSMGAFFLNQGELKRVMHFAELDSDKWCQYADMKSFPASWIYRREHRTLFAFEQRLAHAVDQNVFCTGLEQEIFNQRIPGAPSMILRNGIDLEAHQPAPEQAEEAHIVFVGVMNYYPNVEGCLWFVRDIWPELRRRHPAARFTIVGSHPTPEIERLGREPGVTVTGFVDDPKDWLRRGAISVAPLRIARGIQNKVLEAMAMGLPVVGTTAATQGVEAESGRDLIVADDAVAQIEAVAGLIEAPERARVLGAQGRRFVEERYDWEVCLEPLDRLLEELSGKGNVGA